ncbi:MAG: gliding motility-associated C-terminal domain-containing protein [Bacteroidetes bacterium]|nr:gliding motility-associated C-terminal domain-containing protein [Bacteroidota bacterium]
MAVDIEVTGCIIEPQCVRIDFLEDFGTGVGRFETPFTNYIFQPVGQVDDGQYVISNSTAGLNTGWFTDMTDHTGDQDGRMLIVNADFASGEFYRRTITLESNIDYTFSAWITTVYDTDTAICTGTGIPANVIFRIEDADGNTIAETETGDIENGSEPNWQEYLINFNSLENSDVQLVLVNNSVGGCGNDLAIDDISLTYITDAPELATPEDMIQCDISGTTSIFNLEDQIPVILDGLEASDFNISFHLNEFDASSNTNAIANPDAYENTENPQEIFVRVERVEQPLCFDTVFFDIEVIEGVVLETNLPVTVEVCEDEDIPALDATPINGGLDLSLVTYTWSFEGEVVSQEAVYTPTSAGIYSVVIDFDNCSELTVDIEVFIQELPTLDLGQDQVLCDGDRFEIQPVITGSTADITYLWSTGETTPTIVVTTSGAYILEITDGSCVVTDAITITFGDFPVVGINDTIFSCPNETQLLTATSSISDVTYAWFRNGVNIPGETGASIEVLIDESVVMSSIIYSVEVNSNGCVATAEVEVRAYPNNGNCVISQGLSPDGSIGMNDNFDLTFLAVRAGIDNLQIFNRQGRIVYEKSNYTNEWTGNSSDGNKLPTGTYYYVISFSGEDPIYGMQKTGWIYINRAIN